MIGRYPIYETDGVLAALEQDGAAVLGDALPADKCAEARAKIDALTPQHWDEAHDDARGVAIGRFLDRYLCVFNREPYWLQFLDRPGVIEVAEAALGRDCHVIGQTAWRSHPDFRGEPLHVDFLPVTWPEGVVTDDFRVPAFILTVHFYLNDVTSDLAPTCVVPGSHRAGRAPSATEKDWRGREAEAVLARAGDCLVFRSDVWHAGSDNRTRDGIRYLLQVHYGRREMAQHFSPFVEWRFNPAVIAATNARQRRLLGDHAPGPYD
ncbi:MAG TPA: phytanoyl-CoA dioxygenase family protein [Burkholderiales bacterium]|nr:phytanoyl-CoA dioxygenase family protein [Burkholderiales bacterium]